MKRDVMKYVIVGVCAFAIGGVTTLTVNAKTNSTKTIVADMYTYTCEHCGYEKAEGDYSYVSQQGFERCPECGAYKEITSPRD